MTDFDSGRGMVDLLPERDRPPKMELGHSSYSIWMGPRPSIDSAYRKSRTRVSTERQRNRSNDCQSSPVSDTQLGEGVFDTQSELQVSISSGSGSSGSGNIRSAEIAQGANRHLPAERPLDADPQYLIVPPCGFNVEPSLRGPAYWSIGAICVAYALGSPAEASSLRTGTCFSNVRE